MLFYVIVYIFSVSKFDQFKMENSDGIKIESSITSDEPLISALDVALFVVIMTVAYFWYFKRDKPSNSTDKKPYTIQ